MSDKPEFLYFNAAGRATPARIALFVAFGKEWVNETIDWDTFVAEKKKLADNVEGARLVSGSLPQIKLPSGETFCQTLSIARWACISAINNNNADIKKFYPIDNSDHFIIMDEAMAFAMEIIDKAPGDPDPEIKKKKREEYASKNGFMGKGMKLLEKRLSLVPGTFLLGDEPCLADFTIYTLTNMISIGFFDHIPDTYVEQFSSLSKHMKAVCECDLMKKYIYDFGEQGGK